MQYKTYVAKFDVLSLQKVSELTTVKPLLSYKKNYKNYAIYDGIPVQNFTEKWCNKMSPQVFLYTYTFLEVLIMPLIPSVSQHIFFTLFVITYFKVHHFTHKKVTLFSFSSTKLLQVQSCENLKRDANLP
jgi:hypothetical protein